MNSDAQSANQKSARKPIFGVLALVGALAGTMFSLSVYSSGRGAGFEGFGAMLVGIVIGGLGVILVAVLALISKARKEQPGWIPSFSIAVAILGMLLLVAAG